MRERSNTLLSRVPKDLLVLLVILLSSSASFGLGMLTERETTAKKGSEGFKIEQTPLTAHSGELPAAAYAASSGASPQAEIVSPATTGKYVASKHGKRYYLPSCSGAARIKDSNKIWFATVEDAQKAGLTPADNCDGL